MKRIAAFITAAAMVACCFSCEDKNKKSSEAKPAAGDTTVSDGSVDEPVIQDKPEFREFKAEDFKIINVNITKTDKEPPFTIHSLNITDLDFGERISPCKGEKYRDRYKPDFSMSIDHGSEGAEADSEQVKQLEEEWEKKCSQPSKGITTRGWYKGNDIYYVVSYDDNCGSDGFCDIHDLSVFRVDGLTGKTEELYRHSDPESAIWINQLYWYHDRLYLVMGDNKLMYLDNGELVQMDYLPDYSNHYYPNNADRLIVMSQKVNYKEVADDYEPGPDEIIQVDDDGRKSLYTGSEIVMSEYFTDTDTWKELYRKSVTAEEGQNEDGIDLPDICGELFSWTERKGRSRKFDVVTDEYRVSTGLTSCNVLYAGHDKLVVDFGGNINGNTVHFFDLNKKECYVLDCSSLGINCEYFNGGLFVYPEGNSGTLYYIIPELGLTFPFFKLGGNFDGTDYADRLFNIYNDEGCLSFEESVATEKKKHKEGNTVYYTDYKYNTTRYWINGDEMNG